MRGRFLQIHTLTSYAASLLNRDDVGFAKRLPFGGADRTRISSQCLKRHWRRSDSNYALSAIGDGTPMAIRSRRIFEREIYTPLVNGGKSPDVVRAACEGLIAIVLPEGKAKKARKTKDGEEPKEATTEVARTEQVIVLGEPEVVYLRGLVEEIVSDSTDAKAADKLVKDRFDKNKQLKANLAALRLNAGLDAAMFGRMTTGDVLARCDAAIHVAHAFTVHKGFFETDYFSAVDDLQPAHETGSGHINTAELSTGLFYGYVVVDLPLLVSNIEGCPRRVWEQADTTLTGEVVERLVHLIARESPGAKLGATAPYSRAHLVLVEHGSAQPRTLANAFLTPVEPDKAGGDLVAAAYAALGRHLEELDSMYADGEARRLAGVGLAAAEGLVRFGGGQPFPLGDVAAWARARATGAVD